MRILQENRPFARYKDRFMTDTDHSIERSYQRELVDFNAFPTRQSYVDKHKLMIAQAMQKILSIYNDESHHYVLYSKGTGLGLVIDWRHDKFVDDGKNHAYVITVLPQSPFPHYLKYKTDIRIVVEVRKKVQRLNLDEQISSDFTTLLLD